MKNTNTTDTTTSRARTGKIARLPNSIRQQLNQRMLDGHEGKDLVQWLNSLPEVQSVMAAKFQGHPIREQNLSEWRQGGYKDWQNAQALSQAVAAVEDEIGELQETVKDGLNHRIALYLAAHNIVELKRLSSEPDSEEKAKRWRAVSASVVALRRGDLELERVRLQQEKLGLRQKTKEEREAEFWQWAAENINRDEFCRRRCFTAEERRVAINKILGITPEERGEVPPQPAEAAPVCSGQGCPAQSDPVRPDPGV